jgi:hypothetical protein
MADFSGESDYIRLVHLRHWDSRDKRFRTSAFQRSSAKQDPLRGVSIISTECISKGERTVCQHISHFYCTVASEPPVFLLLKKSQLTDGDYIQENSEIICEGEVRKDSCHYNFVGWNDGQCKRFIAPFTTKPRNFVICDENGERELTVEDIEKWREASPEFY